MTEMEEADFNASRQEKQPSNEVFHLLGALTLIEQLFSIFSRYIRRDQPNEFAHRPSLNDFLVWTEGIGRTMGGEGTT